MAVISYPVRTERLFMRGYRPGDLDDLVAYHSLPEVARFQFWETRSRSDLIGKIEEWAPRIQITSDCDTLAWVVEARGTSKVIGDVFLALRDREAGQGEIGYSFNPEFQGKGLASEAVRGLVGIGFETLDLHRIYARCDARNLGSWKLLERLGFRREAHFRQHALFKGEWDEEFYYAILKDEWHANSG